MSAYRGGKVNNRDRPASKAVPLQRARDFFDDDSGSELLEWILLAFVLLMATGFVLYQITGEVMRIFEGILRELAR